MYNLFNPLFFLFNDNLTLVFRRELTFLLPVFVSQFLQVLFVFSPSPFFPPSPCNEKIKIKWIIDLKPLTFSIFWHSCFKPLYEWSVLTFWFAPSWFPVSFYPLQLSLSLTVRRIHPLTFPLIFVYLFLPSVSLDALKTKYHIQII